MFDNPITIGSMDLADALRFIVLLTSTGVLASAWNWHLARPDADFWLQGNSTDVNQLAASSEKNSERYANRIL